MPASNRSIVGLYQSGGSAEPPSRICISRRDGQHRFGLAGSYEGPESCTMRGRVRRNGTSLALLIDGDPACRLSGTATAGGLELERPQGPECGYFCGRNTELNGGAFVRVGGTEVDTRKLVDIAGEPLCP